MHLDNNSIRGVSGLEVGLAKPAEVATGALLRNRLVLPNAMGEQHRSGHEVK